MKLAACQREAYLRRLTTRVLSCEPTDGGFQAVLEDTVLYPEGGGQPADSGTVGGLPVLDVFRDPKGEILHLLPAALQPGEVEVVVDWERRYDHMQQHTAQHLITALAQDRLGAATTSFHLGGERCDIELDLVDLPAARVAALEQQVNAEVRAARPVRSRLVDPEQLAALPVRTRGLPAGHQGAVRLVEIEGIDLNTCGGTHVGSTAELQIVKLIDTERLRGGTRLYYLAGGRVLSALSRGRERERALSRVLSCSPEEQCAAVERLLETARAADKARRLLLAEIAAHEGARLAAGSEAVVSSHRSDGDLAFLNAVAGAALERRPGLLLLLTCGDPAGSGQFLLAGPPERVRELAARVTEILEGRGGGAPGRFQGKSARLDRRGELLSLLR